MRALNGRDLQERAAGIRPGLPMEPLAGPGLAGSRLFQDRQKKPPGPKKVFFFAYPGIEYASFNGRGLQERAAGTRLGLPMERPAGPGLARSRLLQDRPKKKTSWPQKVFFLPLLE